MGKRALTTVTVLLTILTWTEATSEPIPICCVADQWQTTEIHTYFNSINPNYDYGEVVSNLAYDYINKREVYYTTRTDNMGKPEKIDYYMLYEEGLMYVYTNETDTCIKENLTGPFYQRCVPGDAEMVVPEFYYGVEGKNLTAFRAKWSLQRKAGNFLFIDIAITEDCVPLDIAITEDCVPLDIAITEDCVPLVEKLKIFPNGGGGLETETAEFTNFKIGNIPESLFDLPSACCSAEFGTPEHYPSIAFDL